MLKSTNRTLAETKKRDLTQTMTFTISHDLKSSKNINLFRMVCDGKITQVHEYFHYLTLEAKREKKDNINEDIVNILNTQDSQGKTPLFYAM